MIVHLIAFADMHYSYLLLYKSYPFIFVEITFIGSMDQFNFDISIRNFKNLPSNFNSKNSPFAKIMTLFRNVFYLGSCSLLIGEINSNGSRKSRSLFN